MGWQVIFLLVVGTLKYYLNFCHCDFDDSAYPEYRPEIKGKFKLWMRSHYFKSSADAHAGS